MPKHPGTVLAGRDSFGGTKTEPPKEDTPTYDELNINKKDASIWQFMADHEGETFVHLLSDHPHTYKGGG